MRILLVLTVASLAYMCGFQSGYNKGYALAHCEGLPWKEQLKCYEVIGK